MKEMSLKDIQDLSLEILGKVDLFCTKTGVDYSLGYGALIGAVRHKGFIPWDDDIDLIMTRPNYSRFVESFNNSQIARDNGLKLYAPELGNSYYGIAKICDMRSTRVRKYYQWTDDETGMWIDVFPLDSLPLDKGEKLRQQSARCFNACGARVPFSKEFGFKRHLKILGKRLLYYMLDRRVEVAKYLEMVYSLPSVGSTDFLCNFDSPYGVKDIHSIYVFSTYERVQFADKEVSIISCYDQYLKTIYGDYMQLPPESERVRKHSVNRYFWK